MTTIPDSTLQSEPYDIIFAGAGLSGLTMALELSRRPAFRDKRILLIDRDSKQQNDRTWCFWATDSEPLPPVVHKIWKNCLFFAPGFERKMAIAPYRYHMIRGIDFYRWAWSELEKNPRVHRLQARITNIDAKNGRVSTSAGDFTAGLVFNSAFTRTPVLPAPSALYPAPPLSPEQNPRTLPGSVFLLQHFKGWVVETPAPTFDPETVTFMDFRIEQCGETRFVYVLPFSETKAMVEFTIFSPALLPEKAYEEALQDYLKTFIGITEYRILEEEFGVIPMTDYPFPAVREGRVIHIGTAGGFVKASSGYAFKRTQRKVRAFVDAWERSGHPDPELLRSDKLFRVFDSIFLRVLHRQNELGQTIFTRLFQKLPSDLVLRFLDEDSTFTENIRLVSAPPARPFLQAFIQQLPFMGRV